MKYLFSLLMFVSVFIFANAQTGRVGLAPCYQLSDSLGTAVVRYTSFQPYEPEPYWYMPAKADVGYYYSNAVNGCSGKQPLRKPIVIIDGFDAEDKRRFKEIYNEGETPFDAYYAPIGGNEAHASLNQNSVAWIMRELNGTPNTNLPTSPLPYNYNASIVAAHGNVDCINTPRTYSLFLPNGTPANAIITWIPDANTTLLSPNGGNTMTVTTTGGPSVLRVEIATDNACYVKGFATKNISVLPASNYVIGIVPDNNNPFCPVGRSLPDNPNSSYIKNYSYVFPATLPNNTGVNT